MTQTDRVYRALLCSTQLRTASQLARLLDMPDASLRRCVSTLRALGVNVRYVTDLSAYLPLDTWSAR